MAARPEKHEELGRCKVLEGKTWNHPVVAHGKLFVRNGEEVACFKLSLQEADISKAASTPRREAR